MQESRQCLCIICSPAKCIVSQLVKKLIGSQVNNTFSTIQKFSRDTI